MLAPIKSIKPKIDDLTSFTIGSTFKALVNENSKLIYSLSIL